MRLHNFTSAVVVIAWIVGCDGLDDSVEPRRGAGSADSASELSTRVGAGGLRMLTPYEYAHTIHDLFGADIVVPRLSHAATVSGWSTVGASVAAIIPSASDDLEAAALDIAKQVFAESKRSALVGCAPSGALDDACTRKFIETRGPRVFRRPLAKEEIDDLVAAAAVAAADLGDPWAGLEMAVAAMLESPSFVYRLDAIEPDPESPGASRFTASTMASRLSYFLWSSAPDDELLAAAARGELGTSEGVRKSTDRMLATDKAERSVSRFFDEWLDVGALETVDKDTNLFPELTPALRLEMREQISQTVRDLLWVRGASYLDLFDTRDIMMSPALAPLYGVQPPSASGFTKMTFPADSQRAGILGWAGVLTLKSRQHASSPTLRGLFVRERLLCQTVAAPPPELTQQQPQEENGKPLTTRQKAEARLTNPNCGGCHARMDGIGLGLENFDPIGRYRTQEGSTPVDPSGQVDGAPFASAVDLAKLVRNHRDVTQCGARNLFRYATGRIEGPDDVPRVQELATKFAGVDHRMKRMFAEIANSDAFRRPKTTPEGDKR